MSYINVVNWLRRTEMSRAAAPNIIHSVTTTDRHEAVVELCRVEQSPGLSGLFQDWQHDLVPQGCVEADDLLDVAEQLSGLHLCQQTTLLQV